MLPSRDLCPSTVMRVLALQVLPTDFTLPETQHHQEARLKSGCMHVRLLSRLSCIRLCAPVACSLPCSCAQNTGVGCHALLQDVFPAQRSNSRLCGCCTAVDSLPLSQQGRPEVRLQSCFYDTLPKHLIFFFFVLNSFTCTYLTTRELLFAFVLHLYIK